MVTVYSPPRDIEQPKLDFSSFDDYQKQSVEYIEKLKQWLYNTGRRGGYTGTVIQFPVADGYAQYMIVSIKPARVIHLPLLDAYAWPYIERMDGAFLREEAEKSKNLKELFK